MSLVDKNNKYRVVITCSHIITVKGCFLSFKILEITDIVYIITWR